MTPQSQTERDRGTMNRIKERTVKGYRQIRAPGHPMAYPDGWAYEHRIVAYDGWGPSYPNEVWCSYCSIPLPWKHPLGMKYCVNIDHRNNNRSDNRFENLELSCYGCNNARKYESVSQHIFDDYCSAFRHVHPADRPDAKEFFEERATLIRRAEQRGRQPLLKPSWWRFRPHIPYVQSSHGDIKGLAMACCIYDRYAELLNTWTYYYLHPVTALLSLTSPYWVEGTGCEGRVIPGKRPCWKRTDLIHGDFDAKEEYINVIDFGSVFRAEIFDTTDFRHNQWGDCTVLELASYVLNIPKDGILEWIGPEVDELLGEDQEWWEANDPGTFAWILGDCHMNPLMGFEES